jgi:citrate synthase
MPWHSRPLIAVRDNRAVDSPEGDSFMPSNLGGSTATGVYPTTQPRAPVIAAVMLLCGSGLLIPYGSVWLQGCLVRPQKRSSIQDFGVHCCFEAITTEVPYASPGRDQDMNPTKSHELISTKPGTTSGTDGRDTLTITDNRTGRQYEIPIKNDTIHATDLRKIKVNDSDFGMMSYDPSFANTATCTSKITFIDGDRGILRYRGYSIEELAEKSTYPETAYLILHGELPTKAQLADWNYHITHHTFIHESIKKFLDGFHYDAHPMGMLISTVAALSTFYPDAKDIFSAESRTKQTYRLIGKMPTLAAFAYRHSLGMPFVYPDNDLTYTGNFLNMLFRTTELQYRPNPTLERALDILFILHADHEQNCSSTAMRCVGSSHVDPYSAIAAATAALYGPLHGGANEQVLRMLLEIGSVNSVPAYVKRVKAGEKLLMGFGHRVYKNYDPRARIVKRIAYEVFDVMGRNPLIDIALECERIALEDEYFVSRRLYPNVDFYTGLIYQAMGFPVTMFPVLFAIPRTSGWIAQWQEMLLDPEQKIYRPRQVYLGYDLRSYIPLERRSYIAVANTKRHLYD